MAISWHDVSSQAAAVVASEFSRFDVTESDGMLACLETLDVDTRPYPFTCFNVVSLV